MKAKVTRLGCLLWVVTTALTLGVVPAQAERAVLDTSFLQTNEDPFNPIPGGNAEGQVEGACGLAVGAGTLFVSDYYHRAVHRFSPETGAYMPPSISTAAAVPNAPPEGPCALAHDSAGNLYASFWHQGVVRLRPTIQLFDPGNATGVAVDAAGRVYVNRRTYVAVYEPSGTPVFQLGLGSIVDGYGVAVDPAGKRVYVPDAVDDTVKVYEPATSLLSPVAAIKGPSPGKFVSLVDAGLTVDPTNGHLLIADNLKPGYEKPEAAIYEFDEKGAFLSRLSCAPVHGEPTGLAVHPGTGDLYVTTGNSEKSNVFAYGPYTTEPVPTPPCKAPTAPTGDSATAPLAAGFGSGAGGPAASASEIVQRRGVRVRFDGKLTPRALPRHGAAPVGIVVDAEITSTDSADPPQLRRISIAINRHGHFDSAGLSRCRLRDIQPSTTVNALDACRDSLVGEGHFSANVKLPEQSPFPSEGKVLAFNGRMQGKPVILAHIYGTQPVPTSYVLPFLISESRGTYGTVLEASLPQATGNWGYVTGLRMNLRRRFSANGKRRSYLSAGCPAPPGFPSVVFPLARTSFDFAGGMTLVSILSRNCKAR